MNLGQILYWVRTFRGWYVVQCEGCYTFSKTRARQRAFQELATERPVKKHEHKISLRQSVSIQHSHYTEKSAREEILLMCQT